MDKRSGVYMVTSPSGRVYIGQTSCFGNRVRYYKKLNCKSQPLLYKSFVKYGFNNHSIALLVECNRSLLNYWEVFYIKLFNSCDRLCGMNIREGGSFGGHSEDTKQKLRVINLGKKYSDESKNKRREASLRNGSKPPVAVWTEEKRKRHSDVCSGEKNGNFGKGMKQHVKDKLRLVNVGRNITEETRKRMSDAHKGKLKSEEWKAKLRGKRPGMSEKMKERFRLGLLNTNRREVLDSSNGDIFVSVKAAADSLGFSVAKLSAMLRGKTKNKTRFIYKQPIQLNEKRI